MLGRLFLRPSRQLDRLARHAPTAIAPDGTIHEQWGDVAVRIQEPAGVQQTGQTYTADPAPTVVTRKVAGPIEITETVLRAPVMPAGADLLKVLVKNVGTAAAKVRIDLALPETVSVGERIGVGGSAPVLAILDAPQTERAFKPWGHTGGSAALPGWASPQPPCDPAFANIRAGMGGVPIEYRFATPDGKGRTVLLGFCESFWATPGRPLNIDVEGAPAMRFEPITAWGRHVPGCLKFAAADGDTDGYIRVTVNPVPGAPDVNPILNAIWVFQADVDAEQVKLGALNDRAEHYVDVGGERDQCIFENGPLSVEWEAEPGAEKMLLFALAAPDSTVPTPGQTSWTPESMESAAITLWRDWFGAALLAPEHAAKRAELAPVVLSRAQRQGYFVALPKPDLAAYSAAAAAANVAKLDEAGRFMEAERMLRIYWDKGVPEPFAAMAAPADAADQAHVLLALARHAIAARDRQWLAQAMPAMQRLADALETAKASLPADTATLAAQALELAAKAIRAER